MATQKYSFTPQPIETLLTWVKCGEIAIPEIQRPFVWEPRKVREAERIWTTTSTKEHEKGKLCKSG